MTRVKIIDEFTDLPVSRQRKWALRHPEKYKALKKRFYHSENGKAYRAKNKEKEREYQRQYRAKRKEK